MLPGAPAFDLTPRRPPPRPSSSASTATSWPSCPLPAWFDADDGCAPAPLRLWLLGLRYPKLRRQPTHRALLWTNHEYTTAGDMFPGYSSGNPTKDQVDIELAAHGGSVVVIRSHDGKVAGTIAERVFNRRITGFTPIAISGPLAGHPLLQTSRRSHRAAPRSGTLNNCGGGLTPWGTRPDRRGELRSVLRRPHPARRPEPGQGGLLRPAARRPPARSDRKWERYYPRFDVSQEPNEYARFGYVVEVDPYDPTSKPKKRTALGRFKHEAAANTLVEDRTRWWSTAATTRASSTSTSSSAPASSRRCDREGNLGLLDAGTLYVAKLQADGTGAGCRWCTGRDRSRRPTDSPARPRC